MALPVVARYSARLLKHDDDDDDDGDDYDSRKVGV